MPYETYQRITSVLNEKVRSWSALLEKKHRDRTGMFIIEGIHLLQSALQAKAAVETVLVDMERTPSKEIDALLKEAKLANCMIYEVAPSVIAKCTGTESPPPILGIVMKMKPNEEDLYQTQSIVIVLDTVRDPGNVGTIIRSADAFGADAVVLGKGCVDLYNPKTVRSTMGALFHLPIIEGDLQLLLPEAQQRGIRLVGTSLQATKTCTEFNFDEPTWLLMGSEAEGLSAEVSQFVSDHVIIPMHGQSESLNVAMATTVLLYEAMRQRDHE